MPFLSAVGFAFQFTFGSCTLDTATGVLTHDTPPHMQTPMALAEDELTGIAASLDEIGFFDYPPTFVGVPLGLTAYSINAAATNYRMQVHLADRTHVVAWMDSTRPSTDAADRLRALFVRIVTLVLNRPGFAHLERDGIDCR
jgi:hypothetical protein